MQSIQIQSSYKKYIADTATPVAIFLKLRDKFPNSILLESSDYHGNENSFSFICSMPSVGFWVKNKVLFIKNSDGRITNYTLKSKNDVPDLIQSFCKSVSYKNLPLNFIHNGLFGYTSYDSVTYFEDIDIKAKNSEIDIPDLQYFVYQIVIAINHYNDELYIIKHDIDGIESSSVTIDQIESYIHNIYIPTFHFKTIGEETSNYTDEEFLKIINKGKDHCFRGDVFQIVLSRRFEQKYKGDDFNLYRALRSINPSPYLFYFDYGNFRIFGSSPEAQLIIKGNKSIINPIAGTFRRTGNDNDDAILAQKLSEDPKENSEHVMLVDLARNDLSRNGDKVYVDTYKEVQFYSHVIHLVSKVIGEISDNTNRFKIVADTFPAGTLSGAPKHMAMKLIDTYENVNRAFYGGCIGFMSFNGDFNQAIIIRSFLSQNNTLYFQAGAGVVADSKDENELQEVHNKLAALKKALTIAQTI
ncbi:MAG: anthranilate synthase component I family protein [Bacteroidota bacterium]|nr:anthranilate synthase component I family protein [Bacteroidota bacterium]